MIGSKKTNISLQAAPIIREITSSLVNVGIHNFNHDITFGENKMAMLTDNEDIFNFYNNKELPVIFTNKNGRTLSPGIYLLKYIAHESRLYSKIIKSLDRKFSIKQILLVVEREENIQNMYSFGTKLDENLFMQSILNNIDYLKNFINFYKKAAEPIIKEAKKPKNRITIINSDEFCKDVSNDSQTMLIDMELKDSLEIVHKNNKKLITLSARQSQCLKLLFKGYSAKKIANEINLSSRTVEHYLERIRTMLNCRNSLELIAYYYNQVVND